MVKYIVGGVVGLALVTTLLFGPSRFFGYGKTATDEIQKAADDAVPMKFKVADAERMVKELDPEIQKYMRVIAEQQVDVANLETKIKDRDIAMAKQKEQILALKTELDRGEKEYVFEGQNYTDEEVRKDLDNKFTKFKLANDGLAREKDLYKARKEALTANEGRLGEMMAAKKDLEGQIEFLKNRVETAEAERAVGALEIDDSKMSRAKKVIAEINKKMDVEEKVRAAQGRMQTEINVPVKKDLQNVSKDIESYFGDEAKPKTEL